VPPELGVARRLVERGHQVRVIADPPVEVSARAAGCEFSPWVTAPFKKSLRPEDDFLRDWEASNPMAAFKKMLDVFVCGPAGKFAADVLAVHARHPVDVVLADFIMLGAQIAAESANLPCAVLTPNINMRPSKGIPPVGIGFLPATGPLGRIRDALFTRVGNRLWAKGLPALNRARAELGLGPIDDIWTQYDRAARNFVLTSPSFDLVSDSPALNERYLGPVLDDPAWASAETWTPPWPAGNQDPLVLVGLSSTYQGQQQALQNCVAALSPLPVRALVTLGPALPADAITPPTPNIRVVQTAPHSHVLRHAAAAITHCCHFTTMRAQACGVPLVCLPMGRDQNDTAARVVHRGAGVRLEPTASAAAIRRAVQAVLHEPRFRAGAATLRDAIAREATTTDVVALIEEVAPRADVRAHAT
jgi:MGT family glycosyltransferase